MDITENIRKPIDQLSDKCHEMTEKARQTAQQAYGATDTWVHDNPWWTVGMVAVTALIVGMLLGHTTARD